MIKEGNKTSKFKFFDGIKYYLHRGRWKRTIVPNAQLSHDVWNYHNPEDRIKFDDGNAIHHKNEDKSDDRIENLEKMTRGEHIVLHHTGKSINAGKDRPMFGKHHSEKSKKKISMSAMGNQKWKGKHHTEETKDKIMEQRRNSFKNRFFNFGEQISIFTIKCDGYSYREYIRINKKGNIFLRTDTDVIEI